MTAHEEILDKHFLIRLVRVDRITLDLKTPDGAFRPLERDLTLRVMAIEPNSKPELPLREATYDLVFKDVTGLRLDLPTRIEDTDFDMDVDDVTLQVRDSGISTLKFENHNTTMEIDFKQVARTLISVKECAS